MVLNTTLLITNQKGDCPMKKLMLLVMIAALTVPMVGCKEKTTLEKAQDAVEQGAKDAEKAANDAKKEAGKALEEAGKALQK